jgi:negative regulator of flagellin synthesis FlgM
MKIGNPADKRNLAPAENATATAKATGKSADKAGGAPAAPAADPSVKVQLSSGAEALRAGADAAEFDAAKVERMSQAIADGSYKVNAEAIADKLIANAQEVLGKVQR